MDVKEEFLDEKILEYRRRARSEKCKTLETGMYIKNEFVQFERKEIFQRKMSVMLPASFVDLPSNLAKIKYSSEQRPQIIKTSLDTTVNFGFSIFDVKISHEQIETLTGQSKAILKRLNPSFAFYEEKAEKDIPLGWFEFKSYGIDSNVFNLMFITIADGKMVHGIFNCNYDDTIEWRDAARQMVYSVRDVSKEADNEGAKNTFGSI